MREILFRGKRVNNGKWVYGSLYVCGRKDGKCEIANYDRTIDIERFVYKVIPETVGQYTGLTDKNGAKIFEGDIVKIKGKIRYIFYGISSFRHTNYGKYAAELHNVNTDRYCEVIGNIHDNPELLDGADNG